MKKEITYVDAGVNIEAGKEAVERIKESVASTRQPWVVSDIGPFAGSIAMAVVVIVQALFYGDGGIMALGANLVNMMLIGAFVSYYVYSFLKKKIHNELAIGLTAWLSVIMAASFCSLEIAVSGTHAISSVFPAMFKVHAVIGLAEAFITIGLVQIVGKQFVKGENK